MIRALLLLLTLSSVSFTAEAFAPQLQSAVAAVAIAVAGDDPQDMRSASAALTTTWVEVEEGIRTRDRQTYAAIEEAMGDLDYHLQADSLDLVEARAAAARLASLMGATPGTAGGPPAEAATSAGGPPAVPGTAPTLPSLADVHARTVEARTHLAAGKSDEARSAIADVRRWWPDAEGAVKTRDGAAYRDIEELQARAAAQLKAGDADADRTLAALAGRIEPFLTGGTYGVLDAFLILLREGVEALLVIAALLVFLDRSGHGSKKRVIWWGVGAGVAASVALALVIHLVFQAAFRGTDRELIEGIVGLIAAVLLFWVAWWLHRASNLSRWNAYIADRTQAALASGSVMTLGALAFLAVLREGAETALFYLGVAPSIATRDLLLGIALGIVCLTLLGIAVVRLGTRLPLRPFFAVLGILILVMGIKFVGAGVHALQIAQFVPASVISNLPTIELLGFFPTWETILAQGTTFAAVLLMLWLGNRPRLSRGKQRDLQTV